MSDPAPGTPDPSEPDVDTDVDDDGGAPTATATATASDGPAEDPTTGVTDAPTEPAPAGDDDVLAFAVAELGSEHGQAAHVEGRSILVTDPVTGSLHLAALQVLGYAAAAAPVGAATHGPAGVAAAVWLAPELYVVRWTGAARWVSAYRFPNRARPDTYLRDDSGIPSHLGKGSWYGEVPDEVAEAFFTVGILLDEPPFPVPAPPPPKPAPPPSAPRQASTRSPAAPREPRAPRPPRPKAPPAPRKAVPTMRTCALCNLQKHPSQFVEGSDFCVDCR